MKVYETLVEALGFKDQDDLLGFCAAHHVPAASPGDWYADKARRRALIERFWSTGQASTKWDVVGHGPAECAELHPQRGPAWREHLARWKLRFGPFPPGDTKIPAPEAPSRVGEAPKVQDVASGAEGGSGRKSPPDAKKEPEVVLPPAWDEDAPF